MASELVRFIEATKKFEVARETAHVLRSLTGPICVVAVCGRARQGKSFLLNQLLGKLQPSAPSSKFKVGSTFRPCTKGLWLWSKPILRTSTNGQPYHLLLVDAEGIDSYDQTADYSNHIFSLALLLSSLLVYNQMGSIDESSVENLATVCEFARLIQGRAESGSASAAPTSGGGPSSDLLRDLSPGFVWLLRDFQYQFTESGRQLPVRDYMEEVLSELPGTSDAVRAKNKLRSSIKAVFPNRDCRALVRPLMDESQLARLDSLPHTQLRPEFRKGLDALCELLLTRCRPKTLRGGPLTGPALAGLAEAYCRIINEGGVPAIASTWQSVVQSECRRALDSAIDLYHSRLEPARRPEVSLEQLEAVHGRALETAVEAFTKQAVGEGTEQEGFLRRLREAAAAAVASLRQTKQAEAEARTSAVLAAGASRFLQSIRSPASDLAAAEAELLAFLREVAANNALAPDKYSKAAELLAGTVVPELRRLATHWRSNAAAAEKRVSELEAKVAQLTARSQELQASLGSASRTEALLRRELAEAEGGSREVAELREQLAAARREAAARGERSEAELSRLRSELAEMQSRCAAETSAALRAATARSAAALKVAEGDAQLAARAAEAEAARRAAEAARAAEAQLQQQVSELMSQLAARDATVRQLQVELDSLKGHERKRRLDDQERRPARVAAAALPAAGPRGAGVGRKRDRLAAGLDDGGGDDDGDVAMAEVTDTPGPTAGGSRDDDNDGDVVMMAEVTAAAAAPARGAQQRQRAPNRSPAIVTVNKQRRTTTTRTPGAAAVAAAAAHPTLAAAAVTRTPAAACPAVAANGGLGSEQRATLGIEREVLRIPPGGGDAARATGGTRASTAATASGSAPSPRPAPALPHNLQSMKVNELKDWLVQNGFLRDVFERNKGHPTKQDWLALVRTKCGVAP